MTKNERLHIPCRYMIATHAEVQRKVAHELDALGLLATPANPHPRQLDYGDVSKLVYLNNCIKASLPWLIMQAALVMHLLQMGTRAAPLRTLQACKLHRCGPYAEPCRMLSECAVTCTGLSHARD